MKTAYNISATRLDRKRPLTIEELRHAAFRDLVSRGSRGDRNAVLAFHSAMRPEILAQARILLGPSSTEHEDVVQDVMVLMLEGHAPYHPVECPVSTWLRRIVRMCARRYGGCMEDPRGAPPLEPPRTLRSAGM